MERTEHRKDDIMEDRPDTHGTTAHATPIEEYIKWTTPFWNTAFFDELDLFEEHKDVLIVEDDSDTIKLFKTMIKSSDDSVRVKSMSSAEEAGKYLKDLKNKNVEGPDAAIIDYNLSGKNGLYVCHLLDAYFPETKVILVSALNPIEIRNKLAEQNLSVEFMQKPLDRGQILYILRP